MLDQARTIWSLPWEIDPNAGDPAVVTPRSGALVVAIALTAPLTIRGSDAETQALCRSDRYSFWGGRSGRLCPPELKSPGIE
jgi:hypothetical protein